MTKAYKVGPSEAKKVEHATRVEVSESMSIGPYIGGEIESTAQLVKGLLALPRAEKLISQFKAAGKRWVDEHGPVSANEKHWGAAEYSREVKCNLSLQELETLMLDVGIDVTQAGRVVAALQRRGVGEFKTAVRYAWTK